MSKIVTTIDRVVYDLLYNLQTYSEKKLERWISKYKDILYPDFYCFQSAYTFKNHRGDTSASDIILIARDFSSWKIVEVELASKNLTHTIYQLGVFTDIDLDVNSFWKHCQNKQGIFHRKYQVELKKCLSTDPDVLVVFDYHDSSKSEDLMKRFPSIKVGYCEMYMTTKHNATILRVFGDNDYIATDSVYLTPGMVNKSVFTVSNPKFLKRVRTSRLNFVTEGKVAHLEIVPVGKDVKVKIDDHPYNEDSVLILERAISGNYFLRAVNPG